MNPTRSSYDAIQQMSSINNIDIKLHYESFFNVTQIFFKLQKNFIYSEAESRICLNTKIAYE